MLCGFCLSDFCILLFFLNVNIDWSVLSPFISGMHQFVALQTLFEIQILHVRMANPPSLVFVIGHWFVSVVLVYHYVISKITTYYGKKCASWRATRSNKAHHKVFYAIVYCFVFAYLICNLNFSGGMCVSKCTFILWVAIFALD